MQKKQLPRISLSLLAAKYDNLSSIIQLLDKAVGIHLDFMDGSYSNSFGLPTSWPLSSDHFISCHYMTRTIIPIDRFDSIVIPYDQRDKLQNYNNCIRGIWTMNDIELNDHELQYIDFILLLCVQPGFCGQEFNKSSWIIAEKLYNKYHLPIQLDGGINETNIQKALSLNYSVVTGKYGINNLHRLSDFL